MRIEPGSMPPKKNPNPVNTALHAQYPREEPVYAKGKRQLGWRNAVENWFKTMGGWKVYHTESAAGSKRGFPDLTCVHEVDGRTLFAELKTETGELTDDQVEWCAALALSNEVYVWRPSDTDEIMDILQAVNDNLYRNNR